VLSQTQPSIRLGWIAVALLSAGAVVSQLDRMVINLVVEPLKHDFHLTDAGFAMLQSVAFGLFYTFLNLPIGRLADRYPRKYVIGCGVGLFSLFSMGTGLARSYAHLFVARAGVGVGEASVFPAGFSIISDYFPPRQLGRALAVFTMSSMLGSGLAYIAGGALIGWLDAHHDALPGFLAPLKTWQLTFMLVGLPGLILAPLYLLLTEPARRGLLAGQPRHLPMRTVVREMWARRSVLGLMFAGFSMVTLVSYSTSVWTPALFIRVYHWSPAHVGFWLGVLYLSFGIAGGITAGWVTDRLSARGVRDAPLRVAAFGFVGCSLFGALAPLMPTPWLTLMLLGPTLFMISAPYPCAATALQLLFPNQLRSQISGLYLMFITLIGLGLGPLLVGLFTDLIFSSPTDVRYSLAIVTAAAGPIMMTLLLLACRPFRELRAD
jgi:MFS family permease